MSTTITRRAAVTGAIAFCLAAATGRTLAVAGDTPPLPIDNPKIREFFAKLADYIRECPDGFVTLVVFADNPKESRVLYAESEMAPDLIKDVPAGEKYLLFESTDADRIDVELLGLSGPRVLV
ncbi:hypothetical protein [Microbaculum marinisediminis]|uniref:Uncharacterized protein n=1 Tax=Microbaculum marinisediminis TaxID=2931392 RepID=A0AAW5R577_9HYPH|nr:hypothetical protein [Microbaculum sp. A6E488]MCT8974934.1 hypothetical protein [Microbaculum sp. A6E488]